MPATVIPPNEVRSILDGFVVFKLFGADTGGSFSVVEHSLAPATLGAPIHTHRNEDEYSYVLEGELTALIGGELVRATAGTMVCKPRGIPHAFWNQGDTTLRILEIISPAGFEGYFDELNEVLAAGGPPDPGRVLGMAERYNMEMDFGSAVELARKYNLSLGGPRGAEAPPAKD